MTTDDDVAGLDDADWLRLTQDYADAANPMLDSTDRRPHRVQATRLTWLAGQPQAMVPSGRLTLDHAKPSRVK